MARLRNRRLGELTKQASGHVLKTRILKAVIFAILLVFVAGFIAVSLYKDRGAFTISVGENSQGDEYALSLSETENFAKPTSVLNAQQFPDMFNMAGSDLPQNLDALGGGAHSKNTAGQYYFAYTFYLQNSGENTADYRYSLLIKEATKDLDKCVRIKLYLNGSDKTYAYARSIDETNNTMIAEDGTIPFMSSTTPVIAMRNDFAPGDVDRITVVMWIEGTDPDTVDSALGGIIRLSMRFEIVEK